MHPVRIGPYLIGRKIGAGAMGTVYVGTHEQTGQTAAIKVLPASLAREDGFVLRFNREIEALQRLNHANIVKFFESGTDDNETYYFAMEYVEGETLTGRLRRDRRIPWQEVIRIAVQICAGLKHAHDVGVVHRDLKPSNLLIAKDGTVKITDFGVAQVFAADQLTVTGAVIGTAEFMSPEQVEGRRADRRSDLYSLGAVIYTMIVGQPPFANGTPPEIMQKQRFGQFDPPRNYVPDIPSWLNDITCQLLEKSPDKRLPDAHVVSRRLKEVVLKVELKNSPDSAPPGGPDSETRVEGRAAQQGPLGATLVRDLVRAQSIRQEPTSTFERLMNNVWVLVTLLVLVVGGLVWFWPRSDDGMSTASPSIGPGSEPDRILQTARWQWKTGDAAGAKRRLESLRAVIAGDESRQDTVRAVDRLLSTIRNQRPTFQQAFISEALNRAAALETTDPGQAKSILHGILFLYEADRSLSAQMGTVRARLQLLEQPDSSSSSPASPSPDKLTEDPDKRVEGPPKPPEVGRTD
jgi:serine/threonine-protein kinase